MEHWLIYAGIVVHQSFMIYYLGKIENILKQISDNINKRRSNKGAFDD